MSLMKQFYTDRYLHIRLFAVRLTVSVSACLALYALHSPEFYGFQFHWWQLLLVPPGIYAGGLSAVYIHNATHGSFKSPVINEFCGHLSGLHQLWGFTGWKLIHLLHHQYSDHAELDVHPPKGLTFWQFAGRMFFYASAVVSKRYREHWGMGRKTRILHKALLPIFVAMALCNLLFWYLLLGPAGFVFFYIPSYIVNYLLFVDINYTAHPLDPATGETVPANLDGTPYYKLANALWHGIYYHANHHRKPLLFNPKHMQLTARATRKSESLTEIGIEAA